MLVFSHKMAFIEIKTLLLCVTMREHARAFATTIYCIVFDIAFAIKKFSFCGELFKRILVWERSISKS